MKKCNDCEDLADKYNKLFKEHNELMERYTVANRDRTSLKINNLTLKQERYEAHELLAERKQMIKKLQRAIQKKVNQLND